MDSVANNQNNYVNNINLLATQLSNLADSGKKYKDLTNSGINLDVLLTSIKIFSNNYFVDIENTHQQLNDLIKIKSCLKQIVDNSNDTISNESWFQMATSKVYDFVCNIFRIENHSKKIKEALFCLDPIIKKVDEFEQHMKEVALNQERGINLANHLNDLIKKSCSDEEFNTFLNSLNKALYNYEMKHSVKYFIKTLQLDPNLAVNFFLKLNTMQNLSLEGRKFATTLLGRLNYANLPTDLFGGSNGQLKMNHTIEIYRDKLSMEFLPKEIDYKDPLNQRIKELVEREIEFCLDEELKTGNTQSLLKLNQKIKERLNSQYYLDILNFYEGNFVDKIISRNSWTNSLGGNQQERKRIRDKIKHYLIKELDFIKKQEFKELEIKNLEKKIEAHLKSLGFMDLIYFNSILNCDGTTDYGTEIFIHQYVFENFLKSRPVRSRYKEEQFKLLGEKNLIPNMRFVSCFFQIFSLDPKCISYSHFYHPSNEDIQFAENLLDLVKNEFLPIGIILNSEFKKNRLGSSRIQNGLGSSILLEKYKKLLFDNFKNRHSGLSLLISKQDLEKMLNDELVSFVASCTPSRYYTSNQVSNIIETNLLKKLQAENQSKLEMMDLTIQNEMQLFEKSQLVQNDAQEYSLDGKKQFVLDGITYQIDESILLTHFPVLMEIFNSQDLEDVPNLDSILSIIPERLESLKLLFNQFQFKHEPANFSLQQIKSIKELSKWLMADNLIGPFDQYAALLERQQIIIERSKELGIA